MCSADPYYKLNTQSEINIAKKMPDFRISTNLFPQKYLLHGGVVFAQFSDVTALRVYCVINYNRTVLTGEVLYRLVTVLELWA